MAQGRRDHLEREVEQLDERVEQLSEKVEGIEAEIQPTPGDVTLPPGPPAIVGLRFVYSPGETRLQYTTDAASWIEVPSFRFDEV